MEQPGSRKSAAQVSDSHHAPEDEKDEVLSATTTLVLDEESLDGRRKYKGSFSFTVPNMGQRVDIGVLRTQYLAEVPNVEGEGASLAEALAYLGVTLNHEKCPQWWQDSNRGIELYDYPPLIRLYADARAYTARFLGAAPQSARDEDADAGGSGAEDSGDVEPDVQPSPQRSQTLASFGPGGDGAHGSVPSGEEPGG